MAVRAPSYLRTYTTIDVTTMFASASGSITFHPNRMSWSYRKRGSVARIQKNRNKKKYTFRGNQKKAASAHARPGKPRYSTMKWGVGGWYPPRNRTDAMQDTRIMFAYSAMKKKAKRIPLYSVIQPATNSLSASGRSKGRRFVSATAEIIYTTKATIWVTGNHHQIPAPCPMPMKFQFRIDPACFSAIVTMLSEPERIRTPMIASPMFSS